MCKNACNSSKYMQTHANHLNHANRIKFEWLSSLSWAAVPGPPTRPPAHPPARPPARLKRCKLLAGLRLHLAPGFCGGVAGQVGSRSVLGISRQR